MEEKLDVLRITRMTAEDSTQVLRLEGKLLGPWVDELRLACAEAAAGASPLHLDLSGVTFVDGAGAALLGELLHRGIRIASCSGFVAELLQREIP